MILIIVVEAEWECPPEKKPPSTWPTHGSIKFNGYSLRYRPDTELVLKDVSVEIKAAEKVGIVGRTGAGQAFSS